VAPEENYSTRTLNNAVEEFIKEPGKTRNCEKKITS